MKKETHEKADELRKMIDEKQSDIKKCLHVEEKSRELRMTIFCNEYAPVPKELKKSIILQVKFWHESELKKLEKEYEEL